jgi:putative hydrolase
MRWLRRPRRWGTSGSRCACREHGVAVEINSRPGRLDPPDPLLGLAAEMGCLFAIDTGAHAPGQLDWLGNGPVRTAEFGITPERVINTRSADQAAGGGRR